MAQVQAQEMQANMQSQVEKLQEKKKKLESVKKTTYKKRPAKK